MKNAQTYLAKMTEVERQLLIDRTQYKLDEAVREAFKSVLADVTAITPYGVDPYDLMRQISMDAIDCGAVIDAIEGDRK